VWARRDGRPLSSRIVEDYPGVITLREATLDDAGVYECKASNVAGQTSLSTTLTVQQSPVISIQPDVERLSIQEGETLRFSCSAIGIPVPSVHIKVPDGVIEPYSNRAASESRSGSQASIEYPRAQASHSGLYECVATNDAGQDIRYIQVDVNPWRGDLGKIKHLFFSH
jgi:Immunoglobulin domain/Immunoglobulin I-set domain